MNEFDNLEIFELNSLLVSSTKKYIILMLEDNRDEEELLKTEEIIDTLMAEVEKRRFNPNRN